MQKSDSEKMRIIIGYLKKRYDIKHRLNRDKFRLLIATILSQRTRDENTEKASNALFSVAHTPEQILKLSRKKLERLIRVSGTYRQKADRIRKVCKILIEKYNGNVPKTRKQLLALPGVGFKTSAIVMMYGFNSPIIAVDVHVAVIANRLGLTKSKDVETIRKDLEKLTPRKNWYIVNTGLVKFGREICRTRNPKCSICKFNYFCNCGKRRLAGIKNSLRSHNNQ